MTKGKSLRGRHLLIIGKASILILIIIIGTIISILVLRSLWRRRGRRNEATKASLSSCDTTYTGVHLTQLITESVKVSIHALKLRHDCLEHHTTTQRRRSEVKGMKGARGVVVILVCGCFDQSGASLCRTDAALMAPMTVK